MVISKSTRSTPAAARSARSRRPVTPKRPCIAVNGSAADPSALSVEHRRALTLLVPRLRAIYGAAITAELALRQQAAGQNLEVADCLRAGVCDPIADQIRALEEAIEHSSKASGNKS
jgi:hypothetical protein